MSITAKRPLLARSFWYNKSSTLKVFADGKGGEMTGFDSHHILWYKRDYQKGWAKRLRDHWYCRITIPRNTLHREIHAEVAHIPVPKVISIKNALYQLQLLERFGGISPDDSFDKRLMVLMALFDCAEPATYEALKRQREIVCKFYSENPH